MLYTVEAGNSHYDIEIVRRQDGLHLRVGAGPWQRVQPHQIGAAEWRLSLDDRLYHLGLFVKGERFAAQVHGFAIQGSVVDPRRHALESEGTSGKGEIRTPMPGAVVRIPVSIGDIVQPGQVLIVVEAMKMENEFKSSIAGKVTNIAVLPGQAVEANTLLVTVETE